MTAAANFATRFFEHRPHQPPRRERLLSEIADLVYHLSVLLVDAGIGWQDVHAELEKRAR